MNFRFLSLSLGSLILSFGISLVAVYSFRENFPAIYAGFWLFALGYRICQLEEFPRMEFDGEFHSFLASEVQMLSGVALIALGFFHGIQMIPSPGVSGTFLSGLSVVSGYIISHRAIHEVII